jgi:hypothetical protein
MKKLLLGLLLISSTVKAEIGQDKYVHFGTVYALQTASYGLTRAALKLDQKNALIFSTFFTSMVWFTKEMLDAQKTQRLDLGDIGANALGQAASIGTVLVFDF